jgi:hypothetical protein
MSGDDGTFGHHHHFPGPQTPLATGSCKAGKWGQRQPQRTTGSTDSGQQWKGPFAHTTISDRKTHFLEQFWPLRTNPGPKQGTEARGQTKQVIPGNVLSVNKHKMTGDRGLLLRRSRLFQATPTLLGRGSRADATISNMYMFEMLMDLIF